jgi:hypothetical protein
MRNRHLKHQGWTMHQRLKLQQLELLHLPEVRCSMGLSRLVPDHRVSV